MGSSVAHRPVLQVDTRRRSLWLKALAGTGTAGRTYGINRAEAIGDSSGAAALHSLNIRKAAIHSGEQMPSNRFSITEDFDDGLPRSRPEEQGVSSAAVLEYLDSVAAANHELHSFMLYRHGHVVAEGWWQPYRADLVQMMHSLTKSVAVCGVAHAMQEGRFGYDDRVISFFPDKLPTKVDDKLAEMTVHDLLTMRTGHAEEVSGAVWRQVTTSWVAEFFRIPVVHQPGTTFVYTSAASFMLSAIVTRTTGQKLRDYLEPRLFGPLDIRGIAWDESPDGISTGGNGLSWKTSDALKLGVLYAQSGRWQKKQLIDANWIREATRTQADGKEGKYGYQWWIGEGTAFYAIGKFGQVLVVFPEHDAVLAITAAVNGSKKLLPAIWNAFPAAFSANASVETAATKELRARTALLTLVPPLVPTHSPIAGGISGQVYKILDNADGVSQIQLHFNVDHCVFTLVDQRGTHRIKVGLEGWITGSTSMTGNELHHQYQPDLAHVMAGGRWVNDCTFEMIWQFTESVFRDTVVCRFDGDRITYDRCVNVNSGELSRPTLIGKIA
jgi:CubicO group peptidase (beta-lactamase class C family)